MQQPGQPSLIRFPLLAAGLQLVAWLLIVAIYTATYETPYPPTELTQIEIPVTFVLLLVTAFGGGGLAAIGMYRLLAYSPRRGTRFFGLITLSVLSILWAGTCLYALLIFITAI